MKQTARQKALALVLSGATAMSVTAASAVSVSATVTQNGIKNESVGIVGSFNHWGTPAADGSIQKDISMTNHNGVWEGIIDIPKVTEDMIEEALTEDETGTRVSRNFSGINFMVRLNNEWSDSWAEYEPIYNRTSNSHTNCAVPASAGQSLKIKVKLDTTTVVDQSALDPKERIEIGDGNEWIVWPVSYEILEQTDPLKNTSILSHATPMLCGKTIKVTPRAKYGKGDYSFAVYYKKSTDSSWTCAKSYKTVARNVSVTPTTVGTYTIRVKAKDASGKVVNKDFKITVDSNLICSALLDYTADKKDSASSAAVFGTNVSVLCSAENAIGTVKYEVYYKQQAKSSWTRAQKYSTNDVVTFKPKAAAAYEVCVRAKDETGKVSKKFMQFTVKKAADLINRTGITYPSPLILGSKVTLNCSSENAYDGCRYAVYYKQKSSSTWTCAQKFSTNTVVHITPKAATDYDVSVKAKDGRGQVKKLTYTFTVTKLPLTNTSYAPSYSAVKKPVAIHCQAAGGKEGYRYAVSYKLSTKSSFTTLKSYDTVSVAAFTPKSTGTYEIKVLVKDAQNTVSRKLLRLKVVSSQSQIPPLAGTYQPAFSKEMEDYLNSLSPEEKKFFKVLTDNRIELMESGQLKSSVPNNDGTYDTAYGTWNDNFDGTVSLNSLSETNVLSYTIPEDGSVTLFDPDQPTMFLQKVKS